MTNIDAVYRHLLCTHTRKLKQIQEDLGLTREDVLWSIKSLIEEGILHTKSPALKGFNKNLIREITKE
ncbi:hypothetical protein RAG00_07285 [Klebsiella variicola subsp. variicola]|uniref:hypothetical protein n=1 Tax=Klebsiella variicola TaxID=244366 RepID=UPI0015D51231|nr:hypothetical protein [Klebsiella variicola]EIY5130424.1 hypothetical protein [Klebsiella variicola]GKM26161.1 hypothetical protein NUKP65_53200 [Klebsiella variicola]